MNNEFDPEHLFAADGDDNDGWGFQTLDDAADVWDRVTYEEGVRIAERILGSISPAPAEPAFLESAAQHPFLGDALEFRQLPTTHPSNDWSLPSTVPQPPRRPIPSASHSEDWLDRVPSPQQPSHFGYNLPEHLLQAGLANLDSVSASSSMAGSPTFVNLDSEEGSGGSEGEADMPTRSRHTRRPSIVDLTQGYASSPELLARQPGNFKRAAEAAASQDYNPKRHKAYKDIEEIDLADETPSAEDELLQAQQQEAIRAQQAADANGPQRIGKRQCIICMENYTNCTATSCGHFYCHECLTQALIVGEKNNDRGTGNCPVCRKPLSRNNKKRHDIIPISFMKKETYLQSYGTSANAYAA